MNQSHKKNQKQPTSNGAHGERLNLQATLEMMRQNQSEDLSLAVVHTRCAALISATNPQCSCTAEPGQPTGNGASGATTAELKAMPYRSIRQAAGWWRV